MKKTGLISSFIFLSICLFGCQQKGEEQRLKDETPQDLSQDMPSDFDFSLLFGIQKKNEINTFEGTVTKDLAANGTAVADLILTEEEMKDIYERMLELKISETKDFTPEPINGVVCTQEPYEEDEWNIMINGETLTHSFSGSFCEPTIDAKQFFELRDYVFKLIKSKDEYKSLPESDGGYE